MFGDIFPDPSANHGEFLILMIGEWLMKVTICDDVIKVYHDLPYVCLLIFHQDLQCKHFL